MYTLIKFSQVKHQYELIYFFTIKIFTQNSNAVVGLQANMKDRI